MIEDNNYYWGMNAIWWIVWVVLLFWIFVIPFDVPGQRRRRDSPLEILKKRFASGQITKDEFLTQKELLLK